MADGVVRARRFELVDDNDNVRATLAAQQDHVGLIIRSEDRDMQASLGIGPEGLPSVGITNQQG